MSNNEKQRFLDRPSNVRMLIRIFYVFCALLFVADFFVHRYHDHPLEALPGFYAIYGLVACVLLVLLAKGLRKLIMRGEDHYDA